MGWQIFKVFDYVLGKKLSVDKKIPWIMPRVCFPFSLLRFSRVWYGGFLSEQ